MISSLPRYDRFDTAPYISSAALPGNRREQQERTDDSIRAIDTRKALRRQEFSAAVFREEFTISNLTYYDALSHMAS